MRIRKILSVLSLFLVTLVLASCGEKLLEVGILQYDTAGALDQAREGFIDGLAEAGYVDGENIRIRVLNPLGNANDNNSMAKTLVRSSDLILAIATPSAIAVKVEADEQGIDVPILFTAVTDPIEAQLIESAEKPGGNVTGTNDMNPIEEQVDLARELLPDALNLGIIYSSDERNSEIQANRVEAHAKTLDFNVLPHTIITETSQLQSIVNDLALQADVIYIPTDNKVISSIGIINDIARTQNIPLIIAEENEVKTTPSISLSINYYNLGLLTAEMGIKILNGVAKPKDIPSVGLTEYKLVVNKTALSEIGVTLPQSILDRIDEEY